MVGKYNPEKPTPKVKILEPTPHRCASNFRHTFLIDGVEYVTTTPIRNLPAKTDYHCLKPSCNIKKHPIKKALKASTHSPRIRKVLKTILTKPQPTPIQPTRFKKEVPNIISFEENRARIQTAQAAAHRTQQLKLRNLLHTKLEERISKEAEAKGIPDCESCC